MHYDWLRNAVRHALIIFPCHSRKGKTVNTRQQVPLPSSTQRTFLPDCSNTSATYFAVVFFQSTAILPLCTASSFPPLCSLPPDSSVHLTPILHILPPDAFSRTLIPLFIPISLTYGRFDEMTASISLIYGRYTSERCT